MTPEQRAEYLRDRDARMRSTIIPDPPSCAFMKAEDRKALAKALTALEKGESPYAGFTDKSKREAGKNYGAGDGKREAVVREMPKAQVKELEAKWKSGVYTGDGEPIGQPIEGVDLTKGQIVEPPAGVLFCTFCGKQVSEAQATRGKGALRWIKRSEIKNLPNGEKFVEEKSFPVIGDLIACPTDSLRIRDQKWPEMQG